MRDLLRWRLDRGELVDVGVDTAELVVKALDGDLGKAVASVFPAAKVLVALGQAVVPPPRTLTEELHATLRESFLAAVARALPDDRGLSRESLEALARDLRAGARSVGRDELTLDHADLFTLHDHPYVSELSLLAHGVLRGAGYDDALARRVLERARYELPAAFAERAIALSKERERVAAALGLAGAAHGERALRRYRARLATLDREPLFDEPFGLDRVWVEPAALRGGEAVPALEAVRATLDDPTRVTVIEGGPGAGKSSLCKVLVAEVARDRSSPFVPILVRLRDPEACDPTRGRFLEMIGSALAHHGIALDEAFLERHRCLFVLDGFDELFAAEGGGRLLRGFFLALEAFQRRSAEGAAWRHKVVVTGRPMALERATVEIPESFLRLALAPFDEPRIRGWLSRWAREKGAVGTDLEATLEARGALGGDSALGEVLCEPLLLYLVAKLHEEGRLPPPGGPLRQRTGIYRSAVDRVSGRTGGGEPWRRLSDDERRRLRRALQATGLAVLQSASELVDLARVRAALEDDPDVKALLEDGGTGLLASFYFRESRGAVEFTHKSFGEYLAAEALLETLRELAATTWRPRDVEAAARRVHEAFGPRWIPVEAADFLRELVEAWAAEAGAQPVQLLADRLVELDDGLLAGTWLDKGVPERVRKDHPGVGHRALEAATHLGLLEVTGWLLALGAIDRPRPSDWLRRAWLLPESAGVWQTAYARRAALARRRLAGAEGRMLILAHADLTSADLSGADLIGADLAGADLHRASLAGADLRGARLVDADLGEADLRGADLRGALLEGASLASARASSATRWPDGLDPASLGLS